MRLARATVWWPVLPQQIVVDDLLCSDRRANVCRSIGNHKWSMQRLWLAPHCNTATAIAFILAVIREIRRMKSITVHGPALRIASKVCDLTWMWSLPEIDVNFIMFPCADELEMVRKYCTELDTAEKRHTFAEKLRDALRQNSSYTESTDDSYAVDISISGSKTDPDEGIRWGHRFLLHSNIVHLLCWFSTRNFRRFYRIRRGGSRGFVLKEDSFCEDLCMDNIGQEQSWLEKIRSKFPNTGKHWHHQSRTLESHRHKNWLQYIHLLCQAIFWPTWKKTQTPI